MTVNCRTQYRRYRRLMTVPLDESRDRARQSEVDLLVLNEALTALEAKDKRKARVVELKHFGGCTLEEIAELFRLSVPTIERDWKFAKAFIRQRHAPAA